MARVKTFSNGGTLLPTDLNSIEDDLDTKVDAVRLLGGMNSIDGSTVRRGKANIAATESRTNVAYGLLTTPDRVQNIVLPTDGLIFISYQATWQESVSGAARGAIFIGANQLKIAPGSTSLGTAPIVANEAYTTPSVGTVNSDLALGAGSAGLVSEVIGGAVAYSGDVTTGQIVGTSPTSGTSNSGPCVVFAAAGTYDVSIQFKSSSGSVTVKNRKLWVWAVTF